MIRHLLKLVWNRKRANGLIMLEIFLSFMVVFLIASLALYMTHRYRLPVGFQWDNLWNLSASTDKGFEWINEKRPQLRQLHKELEALPGVVSVARSGSGVFDGSSHVYGDDYDGVTIHTEMIHATPQFGDTLGVELIAGRFYEDSDRDDERPPVVINRALAEVAFGDKDPVGQRMPVLVEGIVTGVVEEFRKDGEFGKPGNVMFQMHGPESFHPGTLFILRVEPGADASLEVAVRDTFRAVLGPEWSASIDRVAEVRRQQNRMRMAPLILLGIVGGFLLLMVALGLIGVLWQNVTRRTAEIGLRRAIGADRGSVYRQILLELVLLASFAIALGGVIVVQFPLLVDLGFLTGRAAWGGMAFAAVTIYVLVLACGLYPAALASRIQPAEALHYE
ncbi:hypothetical protein ABI59_22235 [Acidobacteria bacterium Mor1]|nr:hypothetical protein ABI59_22235 [Acidobacteria bacterium Mor1]